MGVFSFLARGERKLYLTTKRMALKNKTASIIASNCNGAFILHDMGCRFNTPTVNLYFHPDGFLRFLGDIEKYLVCPLTEVKSDLPYPVGCLEDVTVYFMHYHSFEEAAAKWKERATRVSFDNLFLMMTDKDCCTYEQIAEFDALPYKNKVIFTHKPYPEFKSAYYVRGFEEKGEVGILSDFKPGFLRRRFLDEFDYVSFLNGKGIKRKG